MDLFSDYLGCITAIIVISLIFLSMYYNKITSVLERKQDASGQVKETLKQEANPTSICLIQDSKNRIREITRGNIISLEDRSAVLYDEVGNEIFLQDYSKLRPIDSFYGFFRNEDVVWRVEDDSYIDNIKDENFRLKMQIKTLQELKKKELQKTKDSMREQGELQREYTKAKKGKQGIGGGGFSPWWRRGGSSFDDSSDEAELE